ncbi:bifunctional YncE family protein/alkaline phosphatase family protein [Gloeobacter violaceus]|nr:beta-propeller fold lactonase family protein [Gloeobacter violaceus]
MDNNPLDKKTTFPRWRWPLSRPLTIGAVVLGVLGSTALVAGSIGSQSVYYRAPAGDLPATRQYTVGGYQGAVLPNGRFITPIGIEVDVTAPKPFGMVLSPDGDTLLTVNSGSTPFSVTLIRYVKSANPQATRIDLDATFVGAAFAPDGSRFYVAGGENGNIWVGDTAAAKIVGSVNLNGSERAYTPPVDPKQQPQPYFKGTFPGQMALSGDGRYLYVVDQGSFQVFVVDTGKIAVGTDDQGLITEPNNFEAVVRSVKVGRYPFGITLSADSKTLFVANVGVFQYTSLAPASPTGDSNKDYPLCYPGAGYPEETVRSRQIQITKVDPRNLPPTLRDPRGIRCGYIPQSQSYTVPGLGSPNAPESSSVYVLDVSTPTEPVLKKVVKPGPLVGEVEEGIETYSGSHPNAVAISPSYIYVSNGNNDSVSVLDPRSYRELSRINLSVLQGLDRRVKGIQPVALALSPDNQYLYVAQAGINAVAMVRLEGTAGRVMGHIPTGWWPSSVKVSADGRTLYVASANGRGAGPNNDTPPDNLGSPKSSTIGTVNIFAVPSGPQLERYTQRVLANNGFVARPLTDVENPIPSRVGVASKQIKHVIFLNKENVTHDLLLGDITQTRKGVPVNGEPRYALGANASPNHHELALAFAFSDNFYLEPNVSSDGHRWLTNTYTTEFEQTHWPASYGGRRNDAGTDPEVFGPYPGRLGFTDANGSPDPHDYNQHGGIYLHLARNGKSFVNFGNGYEFAIVAADFGTEPTGIRQQVNVPMEKVVRDNSDHLFPEYNTKIPDAPLQEDPTRFNRYARFKQVFESRYVDRKTNTCKLPDYVDLFYPNDHGGGANDIFPDGPAWDYTRYVQDNDAALGLTVELISKSPCWKDTVIFVTEDDTQNGFDHVDGSRTIFLAISPWVKREYVSKTHTSLASIFKTTHLILGIPPLNQYDAAATDLRDMFTSTPDFTPYTFVPIQYVAKANPAWKALTKDVDFSRPDADELKLRRAILLSSGLPRK